MNDPKDQPDRGTPQLVEVTTVSADGTRHRTLVRLFNLGTAKPSTEPPPAAERPDRIEAKAGKS
jgi:hypothetical protein